MNEERSALFYADRLFGVNLLHAKIISLGCHGTKPLKTVIMQSVVFKTGVVEQEGFAMKDDRNADIVLQKPRISITDIVSEDNPEDSHHYYSTPTFRGHWALLSEFTQDTATLAETYLETHDQIYAARLEEDLYRFFGNPGTAIAPSLSASPKAGLTDFASFVDIPLLIARMRDEDDIDSEVLYVMTSWARKFVEYLERTRIQLVKDEESDLAYGKVLSAFSLIL